MTSTQSKARKSAPALTTGNQYVVIKENIKDMVTALNNSTDIVVDGKCVQFGIEKDASRCLREYVDVLLTDVANKYVVMAKHDPYLNGHQAIQNEKRKVQRERKILDAVLNEARHLKTDKTKYVLRDCFLDHSKSVQKTSLNPIFLK